MKQVSARVGDEMVGAGGSGEITSEGVEPKQFLQRLHRFRTIVREGGERVGGMRTK